MKIHRRKDKDTFGLILLTIGLAGIISGFSYGAVQFLTNPNIPIIPKIVFSGLVLFIAGIFILKGDD